MPEKVVPKASVGSDKEVRVLFSRFHLEQLGLGPDVITSVATGTGGILRYRKLALKPSYMRHHSQDAHPCPTRRVATERRKNVQWLGITSDAFFR